MELKPADYSQMTAILRESWSIWGAGFIPEDYYRMNLRLARHPWSKDHFRHLVLLDKVNFLRSSCKVHELAARYLNQPLRVALLSELFTMPRERRRGFGSDMIKLLTTRLREEGFDLALIFSDLPTRFFARFGFREIEKYDLVFDLVIPAEPRRRVAEVRHKVPEAVRALYQNTSAFDFFIERSAAYWDLLRNKKTLFNRMQWDFGRESLLLSEDAEAYAWTLWTGQRLEIRDLAYQNPDALPDIFAALLEKHGPGILRQAYGWLPPSFERLPFVKSARYLPRKMGILMAADLTGRNHKLFAMKPYDFQFWSLDRV